MRMATYFCLRMTNRKGDDWFSKNQDFTELDIVITGSGHEADIANLSLQLKQTDQWNEPNIKVLG